jgi:RNA polymerase sigma factor (sigma-70 family)
MSDNDEGFQALLRRVREGCPDAARQLTETYGPSILIVIRARLKANLRGLLDSDDFVQDVWGDFFSRWATRTEFESPRQLVAFLRQLAAHRVAQMYRHHFRRQKRDRNREQPLEGVTGPDKQALAAAVPSPEAGAIAHEEWERLLRGQPAVYRQILDLLGAGHAPAEVAAQLGLSERTVRRLRERVVVRIEPAAGEGSSAHPCAGNPAGAC